MHEGLPAPTEDAQARVRYERYCGLLNIDEAVIERVNALHAKVGLTNELLSFLSFANFLRKFPDAHEQEEFVSSVAARYKAILFVIGARSADVRESAKELVR